MKTKVPKFKSVSEYFLFIPEHTKARLEELRKIIMQAAPDATEIISYNMPAFKFNGILVWFAAYNKHIGFYPSAFPIIHFAAELQGFKTSKGAIQFPIDRSIPASLVKKIVKLRIKQHSEKERSK